MESSFDNIMRSEKGKMLNSRNISLESLILKIWKEHVSMIIYRHRLRHPNSTSPNLTFPVYYSFILSKWTVQRYLFFCVLGKEVERDFANPSYRENLPTKKIDGVNMPYLQVNMSDGTVCDLNENKRSTRVLYVCYPQGKHEIYSLEETSTCEYEIVILSPLLCQHPDFK